MVEIPYNSVKIHDPFWSPRLEMNATLAIIHQWKQLEASGCIQNFRLVADKSTPGFRKGWFFADSDAYKWLEAAICGYAQSPDPQLLTLINDFILLIQSAQETDGYLYTYNQLIFPESRWENLQIEHELYCHGHLMEACVSHFQVMGEKSFLVTGIKAADLIVQTFSGKGSLFTPGHEEIEIALLRLYEVTKTDSYLQLAQQFLHQRGRHAHFSFSLHMLGENNRVNQRTSIYRQKQNQYNLDHPNTHQPTKLPPPNKIPPSRSAKWRFMLSGLNGKYFQQDRPLAKQTIPVGHAVRFVYLQTAAAKSLRFRNNDHDRNQMEKRWDRIVTRRMAITGGIGSLPYSEGFGRDYELDPKAMYAETCAALGSMFWNWEMSLLTVDARYDDLFEWQLYNASLVGMGQRGDCYLYNNPLQSDDGMQRQPWFEIPCCPSNLSRTWAKLGGNIASHEPGQVWIHQLIGASLTIPWETPLQIQSHSQLPWQGEFQLKIRSDHLQPFKLHLRIPSWAGDVRLILNKEPISANFHRIDLKEITAQGYDPRTAQYITIEREWQDGDEISLQMEMPVQIHRVHPKVKSCLGKAALSRGPIVYCLEGIDNPDIDLDTVTPDLESLNATFDPDLLGGVMTIQGKTSEGKNLKFIPYAWWANRNPSPMTVFFNL
jgi:DUF1680 family protein